MTERLTRCQWRVLGVLALINFVNFADRTVILPLFPLLREEFAVSDAQLGGLQTVLQVVLSAATIPLALLADRYSRVRIIAAGVIFWSLATFYSGAAHTFTALLVARALVGVGEAAYAPAAQSIISGAFSAVSRARAQAVFAAGMLLGGAAGQALGGVLGEALGWRYAFYIVGVPGLLLGLTVLRLEEPPRGPKSEVVPLLSLVRVPAYAALTVCGVLITFAAISFITWGPDYVMRYKGFGLREAGVWMGVVGFVSMIAGVLAGGWLADLAHQRWAWGRVLTVAGGFLLAAPFILMALGAEGKAGVLGGFFLASFFMSWYHGPVTAVIHDLTPARAHATAVGVYMFVTQLVGGTAGPLLVGAIGDRRGLETGLAAALGVLVAGALGLFLVMHLIGRHGLRHPALWRGRDGDD